MREQLGLAKSAKNAPTLAEYKTDYMKWAKAHKRSYERDERSLADLIPVFGEAKLSMTTRAKVVTYQQARLERVGGATINREVACLRKILSHALDAGKIETNPLLRFKMLPESPGRIPVLEPSLSSEARIKNQLDTAAGRTAVRAMIASTALWLAPTLTAIAAMVVNLRLLRAAFIVLLIIGGAASARALLAMALLLRPFSRAR